MGSVGSSLYPRTMKRCGACGLVKSLHEFHLWSRRDGRQTWCKECRKAYDREYHARHREHRRQQVKDRRRRLIDWHNRLKSETPCTDCGGRFHPAAMAWDHLPGTTKVADVSTLINGGCSILARREIAKCELVCANCHAVRSVERHAGV